MARFEKPLISSLNRREFLAAIATVAPAWIAVMAAGTYARKAAAGPIVAAGKGAAPVAERAAGTPALDSFAGLITEESRYADSPWALAHGLLAFGAGMTLADGQKASKVLVEKFLRDDPAIGPHFDVAGTGDAIGEMHPYLVFKTLVETGLEPQLCARLAAAAVNVYRSPKSTEDWDDKAWLLWAFARSPGFSAETRLGAEKQKLGDLAIGALEQVEAGDVLVEKALAEGGVEKFRRPSAGKDTAESGIWAFTCGGQHLLQAVLVSYGAGLIPASAKERVEARMRIFPNRVAGETNFREAEKAAAIGQGVAPGVAQHQCTLSVLKLNGHAMETLARAREAGIGSPDVLKVAALRARATLEQSVGAFAAQADVAKYIPFIRTKQPGTWRLWFGDGCHALHGLSMWKDA